MINKKLESLETVERSITYTKVERKNDSFLDLLERMKALNSEREFESLHRTPLTKPMINNWHDRPKNNNNNNNNNNKNFISTDKLINMTGRTSDERNDLKNNKDSLIETSDERSMEKQSNKETSSMQNMRKKMDEKENKNQDLKDLKPTFRGKKI